MHKEVEVKARLRYPEKVISLLKEKEIALSEPIQQHDKIFSPKTLEDFTQFHPGVNFLRIRLQKEKAFLTLKKSELNELENTEIETEISDPIAVENLLIEMGYKLSVEVRKTRQKANYEGVELCLDNIEGLDQFIEAERLMEIGSDVEKEQEKLFNFLKEFGIDENDRVTQGYDTLMAIAQKIK